MGANANAGKKPSMLFPFAPEQPCIKQYSDAHRTESSHKTAIANAMYLRTRIPIMSLRSRSRRGHFSGNLVWRIRCREHHRLIGRQPLGQHAASGHLRTVIQVTETAATVWLA